MEQRTGRVRQSMLQEMIIVKVTPGDFKKFWDATPEDLRKFVVDHGPKNEEEILEMASTRVNESGVLSAKEVRLRDTLNATIASELYSIKDTVNGADKYFHIALDLLREDKIRERKKT